MESECNCDQSLKLIAALQDIVDMSNDDHSEKYKDLYLVNDMTDVARFALAAVVKKST